MRTLIRLVASIGLGLLLLVPLGGLYGVLGLPVYHSWGLLHGSFTTAIPALVAASYVALGLIPWFGSRVDTGPRIAASIAVIILVTVVFWADWAAQYSLSAWHYVIYLGLFIVFAALCARAQSPLLLPLFLLVPLLIDPLFGFLVTGGPDPINIEIFLHDLRSKILPAALATGASLALVMFWRRSEA